MMAGFEELEVNECDTMLDQILLKFSLDKVKWVTCKLNFCLK